MILGKVGQRVPPIGHPSHYSVSMWTMAWMEDGNSDLIEPA